MVVVRSLRAHIVLEALHDSLADNMQAEARSEYVDDTDKAQIQV